MIDSPSWGPLLVSIDLRSERSLREGGDGGDGGGNNLRRLVAMSVLLLGAIALVVLASVPVSR